MNTIERLVGNIDARTTAIHEDVQEIKTHLQRLNGRVGKNETHIALLRNDLTNHLQDDSKAAKKEGGKFGGLLGAFGGLIGGFVAGFLSVFLGWNKP